jgi:hypothetical protein
MSNPQNFERTVAIYVSALCEAFGRKATKATFMAYEAGLGGLTVSQIKTASHAALKQNRQFMPSPGELREMGLSAGQGYESIAAAAWECLNRGIDRVGYSGSPNFADGLINATVRHLGGWERVCGLVVDEFEKWYAKDFKRIYLEFLRNGCSEEQCRYLPGAIERENAGWHGRQLPNSSKVYELPSVVTVGTPYEPQVLALPAPSRATVGVPRIEFKSIPSEHNHPEPKPKRIIKKDFPKHLQWLGKEDLEYQLTPEQIETEARNRKLIESLKEETP